VRLGLLGGTFDPVHAGHLSMARAAAAAARLDRVLLVPCSRPPHKERADLTDPYLRFGMVCLATTEGPELEASPIELNRGGVSYTVETLRELGERRPFDSCYLIMGSDSFAEIESWRCHAEILERSAVVVIPRPGMDLETMRRRLSPSIVSILRRPAALDAEAGGVDPGAGEPPFAIAVDTAPVDASSTDIRDRVREGRPIAGLVAPAVEAFIRRQGLYGKTPVR